MGGDVEVIKKLYTSCSVFLYKRITASKNVYGFFKSRDKCLYLPGV